MTWVHLQVFPLTCLFVVTIVLLLIAVLYSRIHWIAKAVLIVSSLAMFATFYLSYRASLGWPVVADLPTNFRFLAADIHEPNDLASDPDGYIIVWLQPRGSQEPRAIRIPYSREAHKALEEAKRRGGQGGQPVYMRRKGQRGGLNMHADSFYDQHMELDIVPPPSTLPPKEPR